MNRHPKIVQLSSENLLSGPIFDVLHERIRLPSQLEQDLWVVDHSGAVCIAPVLANGDLILVRQYRHAAGDWLIELPAGRTEAGEQSLGAAQRELEEETGYRARTWEPMPSFFAAPGFCSEVLTMFAARDLRAIPGGGLEADSDEEIELIHLSPREVLHSGRVRDAKTLLAAALVLLNA